MGGESPALAEARAEALAGAPALTGCSRRASHSGKLKYCPGCRSGPEPLASGWAHLSAAAAWKSMQPSAHSRSHGWHALHVQLKRIGSRAHASLQVRGGGWGARGPPPASARTSSVGVGGDDGGGGGSLGGAAAAALLLLATLRLLALLPHGGHAV